MRFAVSKRFWLGFAIVIAIAAVGLAETEDLGNGFRHHGVATPVSNHRGTVATVDGQGHDIVLSWLFDHRGGYALLVVDTVTGKCDEYPVPFPPGGDCPYASILSTGNRYYTHFNSYFSEFDPVKRAFTFWEKTAPQMAMSMTEDDKGRIWSATYPQSGLVSFDPKTRDFQDYGHVYPQNWMEYPRSIAADDAGWIYFGTGSTKDQIIIFDTKTRKATPVVPEEERAHGSGVVYRNNDGKVYGHAVGDRGDAEKSNWYVFHKGAAKKIGAHEKANAKPYIAGSQALFHVNFPSGKRIKRLDLVEKNLIVEDPKTGTEKTFALTYSSEGAHIMGLAVAPDKTICGGTAFPMRYFRFDPVKDEWTNRAALGQYNTVARQGEKFYMGCYTHGFLLEWDPAKAWVPSEKGKSDSNPLYLADAFPIINRPHRLLAHPDGKTIIMTGSPDYGLTGGGMLIWDRAAKKSVVLADQELLPDQSTVSLVALPKGKLLGGSTTTPGTGGQKKAKEAELYIMDMASKKIEWRQVVFPGIQEYTDLCLGPKGRVYGFADRTRFFVFDPVAKKVVHEQSTGDAFGPTSYQQGPRVFVVSPKGTVYALFLKGIARVEPKTFEIKMLAESPVEVSCGGDYLDGRIYFASGSHVYSYAVAE